MSELRRFVLALAIVNAAGSSIAFAEQPPGRGLVEPVSRTPLKEAGQSGVCVQDDRLSLTIRKPLTGDLKGGHFFSSDIVGPCFDMQSGKLLWEVDLPGSYAGRVLESWHDSTSLLPAADEHHVVFHNLNGMMACFSPTGEPGLDDAHLYIRSQLDLVRFAIPVPRQKTETVGSTAKSARMVETTRAAITSRVAEATQPTRNERTLRVMTFNILQGGEEAKNVGFDNSLFGGSRFDELAAVIHLAKADVVGVQEDCTSEKLLQALGADWRRIGSVYARIEMRKVSVEPFLTVVELNLSSGQKAKLVNCHWFPPRGGYGPDLAQSELRANPRLDDLAVVTKRITEKCSVPNGPRGYNVTLKPIRESLAAGETVLLTGDFNEPSHLDWTARYAQSGSDRWVQNPTSTPLRFAVPWPGSLMLKKAGMIDSFRAVHFDEVKTPAPTWTPKYAEKTPGRRPYGEQCLDRIDRIYHSGSHLVPRAAQVIGESTPPADILFPGPWPSDHRAVVIEFIEK